MSGVQSVDRAVRILDVLAHEGECTVTALAGALDVHKSTASRLVASLEEGGLVEQTDRGRIRLGLGVLRLAGATAARLDVVHEARPLAQSLATSTGETVNIAVLSERSALYVDQVAGSSAVQTHNWVGQRIPLHATSNGKVLLSGRGADEIAALVDPALTAYTPHTVTSLDDLVAQVEVVAREGYAVATDELEVGLTAVAAPIRGVRGDVAASLSVSGPSFRFGEAEVAEAVRKVRAYAHEVSTRLGWRAPDRAERTA